MKKGRSLSFLVWERQWSRRHAIYLYQTWKVNIILDAKRMLKLPGAILVSGMLILLFLLTVGLLTLAGAEVMGDTSSQIIPAYVTAPAAGQGQTIFEEKCQSCHTIGGGRTVGPDLEGITEWRDRDWLIGFITAPEQVIAEGDPIANQLVEEYGIPMPNMGVSESAADAVLAYIEEQSGEAIQQPPENGTPTAEPGGEEPAGPAPTGYASVGKDIFLGKTSLENGGAACISCHNISGIGNLGGGTVGKDLTSASAGFGEQGLTSILKTAPFPVMKEIYTEKPLTEEEIAHLVAFMQVAEQSGEKLTPTQSVHIFIVSGILGFLLILGILQFAWRRRLTGVRQRLVNEASPVLPIPVGPRKIKLPMATWRKRLAGVRQRLVKGGSK